MFVLKIETMLKNLDAMDAELKELAIALYEIDAFKFGDFVTKVGLKTPIYFDLRVLISYPKIMVNIIVVITIIFKHLYIFQNNIKYIYL